MPIKNKITPEIKKAFLEEIKKTKVTGREQGFPICIDKKGKLFAPTKRCEGEECGIFIGNIHEYCPDKVQGGFHTHTNMIDVEKFYGRKLSEQEIENAIKLYKRYFEREGTMIQTPSHHDLVDTLINQCVGETKGTICTGSDLDENKVECWTVKGERVKIRDCSRATEEHKERISTGPRKWIKPLYDKEIIDLKDGKKMTEKLWKMLR